jgi:hypothetical protein
LLDEFTDYRSTDQAVKKADAFVYSEYAVQVRIQDEPACAWWVPHVLKKRAQIIAKVKSKDWQRTHKFGIRIPKSIKESLRIDAENGDMLFVGCECS